MNIKDHIGPCQAKQVIVSFHLPAVFLLEAQPPEVAF